MSYYINFANHAGIEFDLHAVFNLLVPDEAPRNITGQNATSTEVILKWAAMEEADSHANGKVSWCHFNQISFQ